MPSEWLLTVRADSDLERLSSELREHGVELVTQKPPIPLDPGEQAITVRTPAGKLPEAVTRLKDVLRAHPSSKLTRF